MKRRIEKRKSVTAYEQIIKPTMDRILSLFGLIFLAPVMGLIALAVFIDDPGPVFFTQKRVGKNGKTFTLHKYRTMKISTPHNVPTHKLKDPEQYITRIGFFLRKSSLDELPQIWDVFRGKMSIIGPRPALWNQSDLIAEREKWNANSVLPGLTGPAQIRGRDKLRIPQKARLDGAYVRNIRKDSFSGFCQDFLCFNATIVAVILRRGVVEGGAGEKPAASEGVTGFENYSNFRTFHIDKSVQRKVLITGAGSYIGESFRAYCEVHYPNIQCKTVDMVDGGWRKKDFSGYDAVFHVAGLAHADNGMDDEVMKSKYYAVNTDLAIEAAKKSKAAGVKQFLFMSSMLIYGEIEHVDTVSIPAPVNFYGDSKWQADIGVRKLEDSAFHVAVLRPPMIYGKGAKGNYPKLSKIARKMPVFPKYNNRRSMLYIDNMCELVGQLVLSGEGGIYFPQNAEYSNTSQVVKMIREAAGSRMYLSGLLSLAVEIAFYIPGKISVFSKKAFGSFYYSKDMSIYKGLEYQKVSLEESIKRVESLEQNFHMWPSKGKLEDYCVLMSVYDKDNPEFLKQSIDSMMGQSVPCRQFVLVEDGPVNRDLKEVIHRYEHKYEGLFTIVSLKHNIGLGRALDEGLKYCKYDLVARMDADDISKTERCEKLLKLFQSTPHLSVAGTNIDEFVDKPTNIVSKRIVPSDYESIVKFMKRRSPFNHPTVMYRKSEVIRCGGYGKMRRKQDLDLFARMIHNNCYALNINESLLYFRSNADNYKRRKSWEYCKSYITVQALNYKRGFCSLVDLIYVILGQIILYLMPMRGMRFLSDNFLRNKISKSFKIQGILGKILGA